MDDIEDRDQSPSQIPLPEEEDSDTLDAFSDVPDHGSGISEDDNGSDTSSELSTTSLEQPTPGAASGTVAELMRQIRRLEVEEHVQCDPTRRLSDPTRKDLHIYLMDVDFFEPLMCRRLVPYLVLSLQAVFKVFEDHVRGSPLFYQAKDRHRARGIELRYDAAFYTTTMMGWYFSWARACLGFKKEKQLQQRCYFLAQYIREHGGPSTRDTWEMPSDKASTQGHPVFAIEPQVGNVRVDSVVVRWIGRIAGHLQHAFLRIYGVTAEEAELLERIPGMSHVLNLRACSNLNKDVLKIDDFRRTVLPDLEIAMKSAHEALQEGKVPITLKKVVEKLSYFSIRPSTDQGGPELWIHVTGGAPNKGC